jgi:hypothetical protein
MACRTHAIEEVDFTDTSLRVDHAPGTSHIEKAPRRMHIPTTEAMMRNASVTPFPAIFTPPYAVGVPEGSPTDHFRRLQTHCSYCRSRPEGDRGQCRL